MTTTQEIRAKRAEAARIRYHTNAEYRARKKQKMKEWEQRNADYYRQRDQKPERKKQKAAAQDRYRRRMRALGLYKAHRGDRTRQGRNWRAKSENRIKKSAHMKVYYAIRVGKLKRQPCEQCANPVAMAHHDDYSKPLDVRWLCANCHYLHHKGTTTLH